MSEQLVELVEDPRVDRLVDPGAGRHAVVADAPQVGEHLAAHPLVDAPQAPLDAKKVLLVVPATVEPYFMLKGQFELLKGRGIQN